MRLLLDTHVFLWSASMPERLTPEVRSVLADGANDVRVSVASAWEIAIKQSAGKLDLRGPAESWFPVALRATGFDIIPVELAAALRVRSLPMHHRDPFDRLLIAQAFENGYTLVTRDPAFAAYGVPVLQA